MLLAVLEVIAIVAGYEFTKAASASFFGKSGAEKEVELVHEEKEEIVPPNVKCGDSDREKAPA